MIVTATISTIIINYEPKKKDTKTKEDIITQEPLKKEEKKVDSISVDIKGEVVSPGIYSLPNNSRVIDVIEKAGGLTQNANTTVINLSKKITDEMVIIIYSNDEVSEFKQTKELENKVQEQCVQKDSEALINDACIGTSQTSSTKISINTATIEELQTLPGIGESKAKDIISYREENNGFATLEDIIKVPGIGEALFAKIKDHITL